MSLIYHALILNDYAVKPFAQWIKEQKKIIETRYRMFSYRGDLIICCGKSNSVGPNAGKALCLVDFYECRAMREEDEPAAMIEWQPNRKALLLRNWRYFSRDFEFAPQRVSGAFQSIFQIRLPDDVEIVNKTINHE